MRKIEKTVMKKKVMLFLVGIVVLFSSCRQGQGGVTGNTVSDSLVIPRYATGYQVKDSAGIRLVDVGKDYHFALVAKEDVDVPSGYTKVQVPIKSTICMTSLQLSNFTILDAHDVVKGLTGTKNLFNKDILARVKDGRIVKIGMEGNFDTEMVMAANPDVIFISPFKRGGYGERYHKTLIVKLSPNVTNIADIARACEAQGADSVSLINTLMGMAIDIEKRRTVLSINTGGLSGPAVKPVALRMVWQVAKAVKIPVVGLGGIMNARDAIEFMMAGATAIEIGTANFIDPAVTIKVRDGINDWLDQHGCRSVAEIIGCLD